MASCKSCGAPIEWAESASTGRAMPLDFAPTKNGNLALVNGKTHPYSTRDAELGRERRTSHFATCAHAAEWRKS